MKTLSKTKYFVLIIFFTWQFVAFGQTFKKHELKNLQALSLPLPPNDSLSFDYTQSLRKTLKFDKKYRTNKAFGIALTSLGVLSLINGFVTQVPPARKSTNSYIVYAAIEDGIYETGRNIARGVKTVSFAFGFASSFGSIPFWIGAKKNKALRDMQVNISRKRFKEIEERLKKSNKNN